MRRVPGWQAAPISCDHNGLLKNYRNAYRQMHFSKSNFTKIGFPPGLKYFDNTTAFFASNNPCDCSPNIPCDCSLQEASDYRVYWTNVNGMLLINTNKTKEMVIYFGKQLCLDDVLPLCINSRNTERVVTFGLIISSDLTWDAHVSYILSK